MKVMKFLVLVPFLTAGCANLQRSSSSGYGSSGVSYNDRSDRDAARDKSVRQTAYELGKDPNSLSEGDLQEIRDRQKVRELERTLSSKKEKEQYSKVLPWMKNDEEKASFLAIPSLEGRQAWINKHQIWDRSQAPHAEMKDLIETQDIAVGMPQDYVKKSWGDPLSVEVSGNPIYKNERWKYQCFSSSPEGYRKETRYVYFEGGRVVGWETE
ncbi:hypothetical protein [Bdellovibrio svalbardensis]|uniref:Lipoprotein n=1 Tax=Bdellovibrio svalbardensis TaxID=2972972 RepID=A0ABT6DIX5_9BACT|nr:hypothetical protein [Bdellovibrio svalbardensis]MDG0816780.1 hypothetical protein [Bdellovibrio svalbardensis]